METKHYSFKVIRSGQSTMVIGLFLLLFTGLSYPAARWISGMWPAFEGWDFVLYFIALGISFLLGNIISKTLNRLTYGEVDFDIHDDTITLKWIRPIRFCHCRDLTFQLKDILSYSFFQEKNPSGYGITLPFFKIILKDGARISFDPMSAKDKPFDSFITTIQEEIERYNIQNQDSPITAWQSIYQRKAGLLISACFLLSFAALPVFIARVPTTSRLFWIPLSVYYFIAVLFILVAVFSRLVNMKSKNETVVSSAGN